MTRQISSDMQRLLDLFSYVIRWLLLLLALLVVYDASMRYVMHSGSIALQELQWHLFDLIFLLGIAYTQKLDAHVRIDIFYQHFSKRIKHALHLFTVLCCIVPFAAMIVYEGSGFAYQGYIQMEGSSNPGGLPYRFMIYAVMPLSFLLLIVQSLLQLKRAA